MKSVLLRDKRNMMIGDKTNIETGAVGDTKMRDSEVFRGLEKTPA